jgi:hypothetical protein
MLGGGAGPVRFGAQSMRTCLESKHAGRLQIKRVAIAVILNSILYTTTVTFSICVDCCYTCTWPLKMALPDMILTFNNFFDTGPALSSV